MGDSSVSRLWGPGEKCWLRDRHTEGWFTAQRRAQPVLGVREGSGSLMMAPGAPPPAFTCRADPWLGPWLPLPSRRPLALPVQAALLGWTPGEACGCTERDTGPS